MKIVFASQVGTGEARPRSEAGYTVTETYPLQKLGRVVDRTPFLSVR